MLTFKEVSSYTAIKEIYKHKKVWDFLYRFIDDSEEVEVDDDGKIYFVYWDGESNDKNYYTNDDKYFWIAGYDDKQLVFLQLIGKISGVHYELTVAQKKYSADTANCFGNLIDHIKDKYKKVKWLSTFPLNKDLEEYYKKNGFNDWEKHNELRLDIIK